MSQSRGGGWSEIAEVCEGGRKREDKVKEGITSARAAAVSI